MTAENFAFWLQGYFEIHGISDATYLTPSQVAVIHEHLQLVFTKVTGTQPAPPWPTSTEDWRNHIVPYSDGVSLSGPKADSFCAVLDDPEAGLAGGEPLGQNLGGFARENGTPFAFAPTQVFDASKPLPSC